MASLSALSACTSSSAADSSTDAGKALGKTKGSTTGGGGGTATPTSTPSPTPAPSTGTATYDTSIGVDSGNGAVDSAGFANLPLHSGAHRFFVNSATGSDGNGCSGAQQPSKPLKTIAAGAACITNGNGDQVLVAEGTTYSEALPTLWGAAGYSLAYPTVIESYDPSDALNEAKYGRATSGRPVLTGNTTASNFIMGVKGQGFIALRGFDINPGNVSGQGIGMVDVGDGLLIENNIFRYTGLTIQIFTSPVAHHWILRNNAIYGNWESDQTQSTQGLYASGCDSMTIEDNVFWHNGWKVGGAGRDSVTDGATVFRHAIYQQVNANSVTRRNLIVDGAADGGSHRGDATITENVYIDNPIAISAGGGISYDAARPNGDTLIVSDNAILGDAQLTSTQNRGWGIDTANGNTASGVFHNLIARSHDLAGAAFGTSAQYAQPSYMNFHDNVTYLWSRIDNVYSTGGIATQLFPTYNNNLWDGPTSGSNSNVAGHNFPNPYTDAQLYAALGFADKASFMNYAIAHPEAHIQRSARSLLFAGYGM